MGSRRTAERKASQGREADLDFLARVRVASLDELRELERNHSSKRAPKWKKVAIDRMLAKRSDSRAYDVAACKTPTGMRAHGSHVQGNDNGDTICAFCKVVIHPARKRAKR